MSQDKKSYFDNSVMERLEQVREMSGLSQEAFAHKFGVKQNSYSDWVKGKAKPQPAAIIAAAYRYSINEKWLCYGIEENQEENTVIASQETRLLHAFRSLGNEDQEDELKRLEKLAEKEKRYQETIKLTEMLEKNSDGESDQDARLALRIGREALAAKSAQKKDVRGQK